MLRFLSFLHESPHETTGPVSVAAYLRKPADPSWQAHIPAIQSAIAAGSLVPRVAQVAIADLTPSQETVSLPKIQQLADGSMSRPTLPLVLVPQYIVLDGHHRLCADAQSGAAFTTVRTVSL
jgi:hypothetical protein